MSLGKILLCAAALLIFAPFLAAEDVLLRVVDPRESPISGAAVEARELSSSKASFGAVSDSQGRVAVPLSPPLALRVQASGFEPLHQKIAKAPADVLTIQLIPAVFHTAIEVLVKEDPVSDGAIERSALTIERSGARTVYEALDKLVPSAYVPSRSVLGHGLGISNSIAIRGLGGSPTTQLLMVVDGRPDVMGLMGHPIPDFYSMTEVGSIRIHTGPASVLYGNRAMAGAIEITPTPPRPGFHTELTASLGSYYTGQDRLSHSGTLGKFYYRTALGIEHTNGHRDNSSFRNRDGALNLSYRLTPAWKASLQGRYGHFNVEDPGTIQAPRSGNWSRVGRGGFSAGLENRTEQAWGTIRFFSSHGHHMIHDGFRSVDANTGFRMMESFALRPDLELDVGGDAARYGGRARNIKTAKNFGEYHISEGGGFARARWTAAKSFRLNAGFRYDHNSIFGGIAATEFGASYRFSEDYALSVAIAEGFRNPTIRELYLFPAPTPTLKPERLWNYQATFQLRPTRRLLAWATGYYSDANNLIVRTGRFPNLKLENIGRSLNRGLEANARWQVLRRVSFSSGYAWIRSTNLSPYVPENKFNYSLDFDLNRAFISVGGSTIGRTWADTARTVRIAGYTVVNLRCTVLAGKQWSVFAAVDNLLNRKYEELYGYPMPGTNAAAGFKFRF